MHTFGESRRVPDRIERGELGRTDPHVVQVQLDPRDPGRIVCDHMCDHAMADEGGKTHELDDACGSIRTGVGQRTILGTACRNRHQQETKRKESLCYHTGAVSDRWSQ
jgi:hypothetical protein